MDNQLGWDSVPYPESSIDKSRVLDIKPLRCLDPVFPIPPAPAPFFCPSPLGPFHHPPPVPPLYPYFIPPDASKFAEQNLHLPIAPLHQHLYFNAPPVSTAVPLNSYRAQQTPEVVNGPSRRTPRSSRHSSGAAVEVNGHGGDNEKSPMLSTGEKKRGRPPKKTRESPTSNASPFVDTDSVVENILNSPAAISFDTFHRADGDDHCVRYILKVYDLLRWKLTQIEEAKEPIPGVTRRPDLRSGTIMMNKGIRTNVRKRIGTVPGVEVGDIFFVRMELCLIGLHAPIMAGIDYMGLKVSQEEEAVAVSIVSSGGYEDNMEDAEVLIYSGQGGNIYQKTKEVMDQKLERGNLALDKSSRRGNQIRVVRGIKDLANPTGKVYVYDGLYKIQDSWVDKGKSGCNVFKYKLVRESGQPEAFMLWRSIQQWREGSTLSRNGVILPDLTSGAENIPVSLVNDVDNDKGPAHFTYYRSLSYKDPVNLSEPSTGCSCIDGCQPGNLNCSCIQKNGGFLPYTSIGVLLNKKSVVHECGVSCRCPPNCRNRVSQGGIRVHLEVFKTKNKGWGLRSWDPIRAGGFICEYTGEVVSKTELEELKLEKEETFIFDSTRIYQPLEDVLHGDSHEAGEIPSPLVVNANTSGNVARFINHSCSPNLSWQLVSRCASDLHVAFHATKHIPPMTELTNDYGTVQTEEPDQGRRKECLCGSSNCRGNFC